MVLPKLLPRELASVPSRNALHHYGTTCWVNTGFPVLLKTQSAFHPHSSSQQRNPLSKVQGKSHHQQELLVCPFCQPGPGFPLAMGKCRASHCFDWLTACSRSPGCCPRPALRAPQLLLAGNGSPLAASAIGSVLHSTYLELLLWTQSHCLCVVNTDVTQYLHQVGFTTTEIKKEKPSLKWKGAMPCNLECNRS